MGSVGLVEEVEGEEGWFLCSRGVCCQNRGIDVPKMESKSG